MTFLKRITRKVVANDLHAELAYLLLADAVANEVENEEYEDLHDYVVRSGEDILEVLRGSLSDLEIDVKKFLPLDLVKKIDEDLKEKAGVSLQDLHDENERWSGDAVLNALGHGISPDDDPNFEEWYSSKTGRDWDWNHSHFEGPHDESYMLIEEIKNKVSSDEDDQD